MFLKTIYIHDLGYSSFLSTKIIKYTNTTFARSDSLGDQHLPFEIMYESEIEKRRNKLQNPTEIKVRQKKTENTSLAVFSFLSFSFLFSFCLLQFPQLIFVLLVHFHHHPLKLIRNSRIRILGQFVKKQWNLFLPNRPTVEWQQWIKNLGFQKCSLISN